MTNQTPCNYRTPYKPEVQYYDEQIDQLRALIQCEIDYALQEENGYEFSYETKAFNDGAWETFKETFKK